MHEQGLIPPLTRTSRYRFRFALQLLRFWTPSDKMGITCA